MKIPAMLLSCLFFGLAVLVVLALAIHASTYFGYDPREISLRLWYGLQLSSAFAFIPGVVSVGFGRKENPSQVPSYTKIERLALSCLTAFMVYAIANFLITEWFLTGGSTPEIVNGQYALTSHGSVTIISRDEFIKQRIYEARGTSGHWMFFYGMCIHALYGKVMQGGAPKLPLSRRN